MKRSSWRNGIAVLALALLIGCGHSNSTHLAQDDTLNALKSLRDHGVLSQEEFDAKVAALQSPGAGGLGDGGGTDANIGAPGAAGPLGGGPDNGAAGLAGGGSEFAGGSSAEPTNASPRNAPHAVNRALASGAAGQGDTAAAPHPAGSRANLLHNFLAQARAKEAAMSRSAHDLALRMMDRAAHTNPPAGQRLPANPAAQQALQSYGRALLRSNDSLDANASDAAGQAAAGASPQR